MLHLGERLTNFSPQNPIKFGSLNLKFEYKREYITVELPKHSTHFVSPLKTYNKLYLLNSGQAAISAVLFFIKNHFKINLITSSNSNSYIGTSEASELFQLGFTHKKTECLWICSSSITKAEIKKALKSSWKIVVIDSTCWALDDQYFIELTQSISCDHLFLARSVSKLDMGGVEHGSLGTLISKSYNRSFNYTLLDKIFKVFSLAPSILDIPDFVFNDTEYLKNLVRCKQIQKNSQDLFISLEKSSFNYYAPEHLKYIFIEFPAHFKEDKDVKINYLFSILKSFNLDFKFIKSFGFNFWNFDLFYSSDKKKILLRISPSPTKKASEVKLVAAALNKYIFRLENEN